MSSCTVEVKYNFDTKDEWYSYQSSKDIDNWCDSHLERFLISESDTLADFNDAHIRILLKDAFWWMYRLYLNKPSHWDKSNLKYFLCHHVPSDWIVQNELPIDSLTELLVIYLRWLDSQGALNNQDEIIKVIVDLQDEFKANLNNKKLWSNRKKIRQSLNTSPLSKLNPRAKDKVNRPADKEETMQMAAEFFNDSQINLENNKHDINALKNQRLRLATENDLKDYPNADAVCNKLNEIGYSYFPESALAAAIHHKKEITPLLLNCLDKLIKHKCSPKKDEPLFMYAFYLLGIFRERQAYPRIVKIMQLDRSNKLLDDLITTYDLINILSSTYNGDISILDELIKDNNAYLYARSAAVGCILALRFLGKIDQEILENKLDYYLHYNYSIIKDVQMDMVSSVGSRILDANSIPLLKKLQRLVLQNKIDPEQYDLACISDAVDKIENGENITDDSPYHLIDDIKSTFGTWAMFQEPDDSVITTHKKKIGRNEPCPCESGKKYKKCCLLKSN